MTNKVDTSLWDIEAKQHSKRVYFNKPQLLTQYIGAKTTVIVAGRRTGKTDSDEHAPWSACSMEALGVHQWRALCGRQKTAEVVF